MAQNTETSTTIFIVDHTNPGPRPMSEEYEDDNQYLVEAILAKRTRRRVTQYLVSWMGDWPAAEKTSWVDEDDLSDDIIDELEASGIVLSATPASKGYSSEPASPVYDSDDKIGVSGDEDFGGDDSGREHDLGEDEDGNEMDVDDNADKPASTKLPSDSSDKSDRAASESKQLGHGYRSPAKVSQMQAIREMHDRALMGAALEAQAKADLQAMDAAWEVHGDTLMLPVETFRQSPVMLQPVFEQPSQAPTVSQSGFVDFIYGPMVIADENAFMSELVDFEAAAPRGYGSEEDAEGSEISEGEQARYDAMPSYK